MVGPGCHVEDDAAGWPQGNIISTHIHNQNIIFCDIVADEFILTMADSFLNKLSKKDSSARFHSTAHYFGWCSSESVQTLANLTTSSNSLFGVHPEPAWSKSPCVSLLVASDRWRRIQPERRSVAVDRTPVAEKEKSVEDATQTCQPNILLYIHIYIICVSCRGKKS